MKPLFLCLVGAALVPNCAAIADPSVSIIAYEGQQVPGAPSGVVYGLKPNAPGYDATFPSPPVFGPNGDITFIGKGWDAASNTYFGGAYRSTSTPAQWRLAASSGATQTYPSGATVSQSLTLVRGGAISILLVPTVINGPMGLASGDPYQEIYTPGSPLPVAGGSPVYSQNGTFLDYSTSRNGDGFFSAIYTTPTSAYTSGTFFRDSAGVHLIQGNVQIPSFYTRSAVTDDGRFIYAPTLSTIRAGSASQNRVIFGGAAGVPGFPANTQAGLPNFVRIPKIPVSSHGRTAFVASVVPPSSSSSLSVLFSGPFNQLAVVGKTGQQAPGLPLGVLYDQFGPSAPIALINHPIDALVSDTGHITFKASLSGTGVTSANRLAVFSGLTNAPAMIARMGDHAPGLPSDVFLSDIAPFSINDNGQVLLWGTLGGAVPTYASALYLFTPNVGLELALRTGDGVTVAPGDIRTIQQIFPGNTDATINSMLSADGRIATAVSFTDGTTGLIVVQIPAPAAGLLLLGAASLRQLRR